MATAAAVKTERITFLGTPKLKNYLQKEAKKEGISLSQLIRQRCENRPAEDELMLMELIREVRKSTVQAKENLELGLCEAEKVLRELRGGK